MDVESPLNRGTELPGEKDEDLTLLIQRVIGFVYMSNTLNVVLDTVRVLRANPDFARRLLDLHPPRKIREGCCGQTLCIFDDRGSGQQGPCWEPA